MLTLTFWVSRDTPVGAGLKPAPNHDGPRYFVASPLLRHLELQETGRNTCCIYELLVVPADSLVMERLAVRASTIFSR